MNIREKLQEESFKRQARMSPAERVLIALELSDLCYELSQQFSKNQSRERHETKTHSSKLQRKVKKSKSGS